MLTELEGAVLGVVWRREPCSTYSVMKEFERSLSASWSASTGTIYPAVRKLSAAGLIGVQRLGDGGKVRTLFLTGAGRSKLEEWVTDLAAGRANVPPDPIRTRANFLGCLTKKRRVDFIERSIVETKDAIRELEAIVSGANSFANIWEEIGAEGALGQLKARLSWLQAISGRV